MHVGARVTHRLALTIALMLGSVGAAAVADAAAKECKADEGRTYDATITWSGPEGVSLAAIAVVVTYPKDLLVVPGTGSSLPPDTRVEGPKDAMLGVSDADGEMTVLAANPKGIPVGRIARVRFRGCADADPPAKDELRCVVRDASDVSSNRVTNVTCLAALP